MLVLGLAVVVSGVKDATAGVDPARTEQPQGLHRWYERYTRAAAACPGLDPLILVAIHDVETGRDPHGETSTAGAIGPMQFLPDTWSAYGVDANHNGVADPLDLEDALAGATRLLCANGATTPATFESAIWNYNHSWSYVGRVLDRIAELHSAFGS